MFRNATVSRGYRTQSLTIRGVKAPYGRIRNMTLSSGRWITDEDSLQKQRVAILGASATLQLFGEIPPENEEVTINGLRFTVKLNDSPIAGNRLSCGALIDRRALIRTGRR